MKTRHLQDATPATLDSELSRLAALEAKGKLSHDNLALRKAIQGEMKRRKKAQRHSQKKALQTADQ